jgi:hypothetical protein
MGKRVTALIIALATLGGPAWGGDFCSYRNTNQLAWDRDLAASLQRFLGEQRVDFFYPGKLREQVADGLGGPPDDIEVIGENLRFASACRAHSCPEKAAIVFACPGVIKAAGILHYESGFPGIPILTVYMRDLASGPTSAFLAWRERLEQSLNIRIRMEWHTAGQ